MGLFTKRRSSIPVGTRHVEKSVIGTNEFESLESRQLLSLMVDLRIAGGGKSAEVAAVDQVVNMEVWATIDGSNGDVSDEALVSLLGSFKSSNSGAIRGNLSAQPVAPFVVQAPSSIDPKGTIVDLDGDGDEDVGSNNDASASGFFWVRSSSPVYDGTVNASSKSFKIGELKFRVTHIVSDGQVQINFVPRQADTAALWIEDNTLKDPISGAWGAGAPIVLKAESTGGGDPEIDASVSNGTLTVKGTSADNRIKVNLSKSGANLIASVDGVTRKFAASSVTRIRIQGLDGDDTILLGSTVKTRARLEGDDGNDTIVGGLGKDTLYGDSGKDNLKGASGNDFLDGGPSADKMSGGKGRDVASYKSRSKPVRVTIDDLANDGQSKEKDNVRDDVENVYGGSGSDKLFGDAEDNYLRGYSGNDTILGGAGNDTLDGGKGADKLYGEDGADRLFARDSSIDSVYGGDGKDRAQVDKKDVRKDIETLLA